jgi:chromate transporter
MILLELFLIFLKIGSISFGGGYAMIALIREEVLLRGWLTESELLNLVAVAESTPGPIAVNMATFVGSEMGGILGSLLATLGVVLPSFIIILLIAAVIRSFLRLGAVKAFLSGLRPVVVGLILATAVTLLLGTLFGIKRFSTPISVDPAGLLILAVLIAASLLWKHFRRKQPSPIVMILLSAALGMLLYPLLSP